MSYVFKAEFNFENKKVEAKNETFSDAVHFKSSKEKMTLDCYLNHSFLRKERVPILHVFPLVFKCDQELFDWSVKT